MSGDLKLTITLDGAEAQAALDKLKAGVKDTGTEAKKTQESMGAMASRIGKDVGDAAKAFAAYSVAIGAAGAQLLRMSVANDSHERAIRLLGSAYESVTASTRGTVDAETALRAQQSLNQSGLRVTGEQLAAITRRAREYALATGTETPQAIDQMVDALRGGEAEGLRRFGLAADHSGNRVRTFDGAIRQLTREQHNLTPAVRTSAEELATFGRAATDVGNALASGLVSGIGSAISRLAEFIGTARAGELSLHGITNALELMRNGATDEAAGARFNNDAQGREIAANQYNAAAAQLRARGFTGTILRQDQIRSTADLAAAAARLRHADASTGAAANDNNQGVETSNAASAAASAAATARAGVRQHKTDIFAATAPNSGGGGTLAEDTRELAVQRHLAQQRTFLEIEGTATIVQLRQRRHESLEHFRHAELEAQTAENVAFVARRDAAVEAITTIQEHEQEAFNADMARDAEAKGRHQEELGRITELSNARVAGFDAAEAARARANDIGAEQTAVWNDMLNVGRTAAQGFGEASKQAFGDAMGALKQHMRAVIEGKETFGDAMRAATQEILINMAMQAGEQAIMETAAGFAMVARGAAAEGADPGADTSAAAHFASAAMYAGIAVTSGAVGGAMARSSAAQSAPSASGGGFSASPAGVGPSGSGNGGGNVTYQFNVQGSYIDSDGFRQMTMDSVQMAARNDSLPPELRRAA